jgi:hypothetical protein
MPLSVLFKDKAAFDRDRIMNFHNQHHWAEVSPHGLVQGRHKQQFSINVWAGIEVIA